MEANQSRGRCSKVSSAWAVDSDIRASPLSSCVTLNLGFLIYENENINVTSPSQSALMNGMCLAHGSSLVNVSSLPLFLNVFIYLAVLSLCRCLGFSLVAVSRGFSPCGAQALERLGFSSSSSWAQ